MYDFTPQEVLTATARAYIRNRVYRHDYSTQIDMIDTIFKKEADRMASSKISIPIDGNSPFGAVIKQAYNQGCSDSARCSATDSASLKNEHRFPGSVLYYDKDGTVKKTYIKRVIYSNPATIVFFGDGTKTICKAMEGDPYNPAAGLAFCVYKKMIGASNLVEALEDWVPNGCEKEGTTYDLSLKDIRKKKK